MKRIIPVLLFLLLCIPAQAKNMRFVQVTDTLYNTEDEKSADIMRGIVTDINKLKDVEFVVFTGNNIAKPSEENLKGFLEEAKHLKAPYYVILGNKDVNKQKGFGKKDYVKILKKEVKAHKKIESPNYVFEKENMIFIALDGSKEVIPSSMGYYKEDVLKWLNEQLNLYKYKNIVIFQHFPVVPPAKQESRYTFKADEYLKLIAGYNNVKAIFAGHFGVNNEQNVNGILHAATENAPTYRIVDIMNYETSEPDFWSVIKKIKTGE